MTRKPLLAIPISALVISIGLTAAPAAATAAQPLAQVTILSTARIADGGAALTVRLRTLCQPIETIQWEGFITATQGDVFAWSGPALQCDGRHHDQDVVLPVSAEPGTAFFVRGKATVRVVLQDENTLTTHASATRTVHVR
jgi:hypothetical protein